MKQILFALTFLLLVVSPGFAQKPVTIAAWNFFGQESSGTNNLSPAGRADDTLEAGGHL